MTDYSLIIITLSTCWVWFTKKEELLKEATENVEHENPIIPMKHEWCNRVSLITSSNYLNIWIHLHIVRIIHWTNIILFQYSLNNGTSSDKWLVLWFTIYCIALYYTALQQCFCCVFVWQVPSLCLFGTGTMWRGTTWNIIKSVNWTVEDITSPLELSLRLFNSWSSITQVTHTLLIPQTQHKETHAELL